MEDFLFFFSFFTLASSVKKWKHHRRKGIHKKRINPYLRFIYYVSRVDWAATQKATVWTMKKKSTNVEAEYEEKEDLKQIITITVLLLHHFITHDDRIFISILLQSFHKKRIFSTSEWSRTAFSKMLDCYSRIKKEAQKKTTSMSSRQNVYIVSYHLIIYCFSGERI